MADFSRPTRPVVRPGPGLWSVVIPVKVLAQAKSRLASLGADRRRELALAMAADTVAAAVACPSAAHVIVVTDDDEAAGVLRELGAVVIPDEPGAGLNAALRHGASHAGRKWPDQGLAALSADLPALRPAELTAALTRAGRWPQAFVPDANGTGTTLYTASPGGTFRPGFGGGSRARHAAGGATELDVDGIDSVRRDVDTPADLRAAAILGLGPRTLRYAPPDT